MKLTHGLIQVYTGNGKGKSTAALGLALRAAGRKLKVCMIQFIKGGEPCGEHLAAPLLAPYLKIVPTGRGRFLKRFPPDPEDARLAREGLALAAEVLRGGEYDLVILDEINCAVDAGLVPLADLLAVMEAKPADVELVLTGRNAHEKVIAAADLVTEMCEVKHYFNAGVAARMGIEK